MMLKPELRRRITVLCSKLMRAKPSSTLLDAAITRITHLVYASMTSEDQALVCMLGRLREMGVKVEFSPDALVKSSDDQVCSGYVDWETKTLKVASGRDKWFETMVHEYCHCIQFEAGEFLNDDCWNRFEAWLGGEDHDLDALRMDIEYIQRCELDCEQKTLQFFKNFEIPVDSGDYIQRSNAYVMFYEVAFRERRWYDFGPYDVPEVQATVPAIWITGIDFFHLPDGYYAAVRKHCFKEKKK